MEKPNHNGLSPLHYASARGHLDVARYLLEQGANRDKADNNGWTSLHYAAYCDHLEIAKLLMVYGADLNARTSSGTLPINIGYHNTEEIKQAIRDEPRRRMDHGHKRATEQDRHPNAAASASAQQEEAAAFCFWVSIAPPFSPLIHNPVFLFVFPIFFQLRGRVVPASPCVWLGPHT